MTIAARKAACEAFSVATGRFALLVFVGGPWDGEYLTAAEPSPKWISIGACGRYPRCKSDPPSPAGEGSTAYYYEWAHETTARPDPED